MTLWIVPWVLLTFAAWEQVPPPTAGPPASPATLPAGGQAEGGLRELWRSNVEVLADKGSDDLQEAIRRLEAIRLPAQAGGGAAQVPARASAKVLPAPTSRPGPASRSSTAPASQPATRPAELTPELVAGLNKLHPGRPIGMAALADTLFHSGHVDWALPFYEKAIETSPDDEEKAWLLFQVANCRRKAAPPAADEAYGRLLSECPDSPWGPAAQFQRQFIEWQEVNRLPELLEEVENMTFAGRSEKPVEKQPSTRPAEK